jgi:cell division septal protein FtsQ
MLRSKIGSTLNKKRKITLLRKLSMLFLLVLFLFSLFILFLTNDKVRIKEDIKINGNISVSKDDILKIVERELNKKYFFIIPTDNFFLLRRNSIKESIYNDFKKIKEVEINLDSFVNLTLNIEERVSDSLWCDNTPNEYESCYFMDEEGFIFAKAPDLTSNIFKKFFGLIKNDPIGQRYLSKEDFIEKKKMISEIERIGFMPEYFVSLSLNDFEVVFSGDGKICFDNTDSVSKNVNKIEILIKEGLIKTEKDFLETINHIDLRYGSKVHYDFK